MQLPQININGTNGKQLLIQHIRARQALEQALEVMHEACPHGRDYQTLPAGAYQRAAEEHAERVIMIRRVMADLQTISEHLA